MDYHEEFKRGQSIPTCNSTDEFHKYNVEPKKSITREYTLCASCDINFKTKQNKFAVLERRVGIVTGMGHKEY